MHVSVDGYVRAASGDEMGWVFRTYDDELKAWEVDLLRQTGTHIMGRRLYEYRLIVHPVVLAGGLPLFKEPMDLKLLSTRSLPAGAVALIYGRT